MLSRFVALTSRKVRKANLYVMVWPAISASVTKIASSPANEAITELITKPDCPNSIKQIFVAILTTISMLANLSAGMSEKILPFVFSSTVAVAFASFFLNKIIAIKPAVNIIIKMLGAIDMSHFGFNGPTNKNICKKLARLARIAAPIRWFMKPEFLLF